MSNDANQIEPGSQEFKLAVIGISGSGKTTLAIGLYGRNHERLDYCESQDNGTLEGWCTALKNGKGPGHSGKRQQIKMLYHYSEKDQCVLDFFDYMGEESSRKDTLAGLIKRHGCVGVVILVNPMHFLNDDEKDKNEKLIHNVKEILDSTKDMKHVALVMTAHDWFAGHKEKQNEIQKWFDGLRCELKGGERDVRDFKVTVYGFASNGNPNLAEDNNAYEPFRWIVGERLKTNNNKKTGALRNELSLLQKGMKDKERFQKSVEKVLGCVGLLVLVIFVWMGLKLIQSRDNSPSSEQRGQNECIANLEECSVDDQKIARLEEDKQRKEREMAEKEREMADIRAKSECIKCISDMREKGRSRDGIYGVVDCFNNFCSEHPEAMASRHSEDIVTMLHDNIGGEFMRIYADITNQVWQVATTNLETHISSRGLDKSFQSLKEFAAKVCTIKNSCAQKSRWYEFARKCKDGLTIRDEAFALRYEVTKIEAMMDYGDVSKHFRKLELDAPLPVMLMASTNENKVVMWEKIQDPLKLNKNAGRIEANKVWQTIWEGSFQSHGNPWRDTGVRMTIKDKGRVWTTSAKIDFVIPLYGGGGGQNGDGGVRLVEKRMLMPLKESSKSKDPHVRIRVHVRDLPYNDSAGNLFSLMPKDVELERP